MTSSSISSWRNSASGAWGASVAGSGFLRAAWYALLSLGLWAVLLRPRGLGSRVVAESLWSEDATIFIGQAYALGEATLWTSYQGYLHTFQRLTCLPLPWLPLAAVPYFLFAGWCLAFLALVYVLQDRLGKRGLGPGWTSLAVALVALQPHGGEVFFSITNAQWVLGLALALYVAMPERDGGKVELAALAIACLTGPFSILMTPVLLLQAVVRRDVRSRWKTYLVVGTGALVQLSTLLRSSRLKTPVDTGDTLGSWLSAAGTFFTFGAGEPLSIALAVAFWVLAVIGIVLALRARVPGRALDLASLSGAAAILFGVSLYSVSLWSSVTSISPLGGGSRYYFVPYGLALVGVLLAVHGARARAGRVLPWAFVAVATVLCVLSFRPQPRENLQWPAFARFATVHPGVEIPINPQWNFLPTWNVIPPAHATRGSVAPVRVPAESLRQESAGVSFDLRPHCPGSRRVGLEARVARAKAGYAHVTWGGDAQRQGRPLLRFYGAGEVTLQFAFSLRPGEHVVTLVPATDAPYTIRGVDLYCLDAAP